MNFILYNLIFESWPFFCSINERWGNRTSFSEIFFASSVGPVASLRCCAVVRMKNENCIPIQFVQFGHQAVNFIICLRNSTQSSPEIYFLFFNKNWKFPFNKRVHIFRNRDVFFQRTISINIGTLPYIYQTCLPIETFCF